MFHNLPLLLSGSDDGNVKVWHASIYNLESNLAFGFDRCWTVASLPGNNRVALGFDQAMLIIEISREGHEQEIHHLSFEFIIRLSLHASPKSENL